MKLISWETHLPLLCKQPKEFARRFRWPLVILGIGALLDAITTMEFLCFFGADSEIHLPQRWVCQMLGVIPGVPIAKALQVAFAVLVAAAWRKWTPWLMGLCGILYTLAAASNHFRWIG